MFHDASCLILKQDYCGDLGGDKLSFGRKTPFCSVLTNESKLRKAGPQKKSGDFCNSSAADGHLDLHSQTRSKIHKIKSYRRRV